MDIKNDAPALPPQPERELCQKCFGNDLEHALASTLNRFSAENPSNTPDWILAQFLLGCLAAWNQGVQQRETWYGRDARPSSAPSGENPESIISWGGPAPTKE